MPPHTAARTTDRNARVLRILSTLEQSVQAPRVELDHQTPLQLLMATILSAQCTDQRVNLVTPALFQRYHSAADYAEANPSELEQLIRSTGFFKSKAKRIMACGRMLVERFNGMVPQTMEELTTLPGVGRKTANVMLGHTFGKPAIVVDTHVKRLAGRLGLSSSQDPDKIEWDLQKLIPQAQWTGGSQRILLHGRYVCLARKPKCGDCAIYTDCHWKGKAPR